MEQTLSQVAFFFKDNLEFTVNIIFLHVYYKYIQFAFQIYVCDVFWYVKVEISLWM